MFFVDLAHSAYSGSCLHCLKHLLFLVPSQFSQIWIVWNSRIGLLWEQKSSKKAKGKGVQHTFKILSLVNKEIILRRIIVKMEEYHSGEEATFVVDEVKRQRDRQRQTEPKKNKKNSTVRKRQLQTKTSAILKLQTIKQVGKDPGKYGWEGEKTTLDKHDKRIRTYQTKRDM